jgi:hypothetical protein
MYPLVTGISLFLQLEHEFYVHIFVDLTPYQFAACKTTRLVQLYHVNFLVRN